MFLRRFPFRRALLRRPVARVALIGGLGYLIGRRSAQADPIKRDEAPPTTKVDPGGDPGAR
jgi:hypothetical protein